MTAFAAVAEDLWSKLRERLEFNRNELFLKVWVLFTIPTSSAETAGNGNGMNAFGKRGGLGGGNGRPQFGVAKPMKGGGSSSAASATPAPSEPDGGDQFPPVPDLTASLDGGLESAVEQVAAMDRLTARQ